MIDGRSAFAGCPGCRLRPGAVRGALLLALMLALPGGTRNRPAGAQQPMMGQLSPGELSRGFQYDDSDSFDDAKRQRVFNAERQKSMVSDADKLLKLAGELNAEVVGASDFSFTANDLRKANEIERLAHKVKEKMSYSASGFSASSPSTPHPFR